MPVKPFLGSKSRLSAVLTPEQRARLSREFLAHTLSVVRQVPEVHEMLVISRDPAALALAGGQTAQSVKEAGASDLNRALTQATEVALAAGATDVLILPADLPFLSPEDVHQMIEPSGLGSHIAIAPDRHERGTNALYLSPPQVIAFAFGVDSFARHKALAQAAGARLRICRLPAIALDVDVPDDLELYQAALGPGR